MGKQGKETRKEQLEAIVANHREQQNLTKNGNQ